MECNKQNPKSYHLLTLLVIFIFLFSINGVESKTICGDGSMLNFSETYSGNTYCCKSKNGSAGSCSNCARFDNDSCTQFYENKSIDFVSNCMACKEPSEYTRGSNSCLRGSVSNTGYMKSFELTPARYGVDIGQGSKLEKRELNLEVLEISSDGALLKYQDGNARIFNRGDVVPNALKNGNSVLVRNVDNPLFSKGEVKIKETGLRCSGNTTTIDKDEILRFDNSSSLSMKEINKATNSSEYDNSSFLYNPGKGIQTESLNVSAGGSIISSLSRRVSLINIHAEQANLCVCGESDFSVEQGSGNFLGIQGFSILDFD